MGLLTDADIALLREPQLGHVATLAADGTIQTTPVWIDTDGEHVIFNTARGRVKDKHLRRNPNVTISVVDKANDYRWLSVRGTATLEEDGADAHIDAMAKKYLGVDSYPMRTEGEVREIVKVRVDHRIGS
jgi:PPOX class probable F420-dependent enzyme